MTQFDPSMVAQMLMQPIQRASENLGGGPFGIGADAGGSYFVDPEVAARTGYGTAVTGTSFFPGAGIVDAAGGAVDISGQPLPSFSENIGQGNYLDAALQGLGVAGDVATFAAPATLGASALAGALLKAPRAAQKIGKATDVASDVGSINKKIYDVKPESSLYSEGAKRIVYEDPDTGSFIDVLQRQDKTSSVMSLYVPQEHRGKGIGFKLQQQAMDEIPDLMGQIESKAAAVNAYRLGRRPVGDKSATLEETLQLIEQDGSVNMLSPEAFETGSFYKNLVDQGIVKVEPPTEIKPGIIAFHGSGADFDEFRLDKIGTGEGAQAFGYGLYFSDSEDIGKFYKNALTRSVDIDGKPYIRGNSIRDTKLVDPDIADELGAANGDLELAIKDEEQYLQTLTGSQPSNTALTTAVKETQKRIEKLKALRGKVKVNPTEGKAYKVGIQPKPEELLDYDLPLSEQPKILEKLENTFGARELNVLSLKNAGVDSEELTGRRLYKLIGDTARERSSEKIGEINKKLNSLAKIIDDNSVGFENYTSKAGEDAAKEYNKLLKERSKLPNITQGQNFTKIASEELSEIGIKGIKFKAGQLSGRQFAVAKETASENYVIFDDKIINILEKYGIVGPVAVSATAAALRDDDGST